MQNPLARARVSNGTPYSLVSVVPAGAVSPGAPTPSSGVSPVSPTGPAVPFFPAQPFFFFRSNGTPSPLVSVVPAGAVSPGAPTSSSGDSAVSSTGTAIPFFPSQSFFSRIRAFFPDTLRRKKSFARRTSPLFFTTILSMSGEGSGNVRSTPTPYDSFRTLKVVEGPLR